MHGSSKQDKINVKIGYFKVIDRENKKDAGHENWTLGELCNELSLIKRHLYKHLLYIDIYFC